jgi:hypothetical protein
LPVRGSTAATAFLAFCMLSTCVFALSRDEVYYGNRRQFKKAAAINAKKVFMAIPAYRAIVDNGIEEDSALYLKKLAEANKVFLKVLKEFAQDNDYDLICEDGALDDAPVVTDEVVKLVKEKAEQ